MEQIADNHPSPSSVALPFLFGVAAASVLFYVFQASEVPGLGARECLSARPVNTEGYIANSGKMRPEVVAFVIGTSVIAGQERVRPESAAAVVSPVIYIRCLPKTS